MTKQFHDSHCPNKFEQCIIHNLNQLIKKEMNSYPFSSNLFLVYNKQEWLNHPIIKFTEQEIESADENNFIGRRNQIDCYLAKIISTQV